jgi:putative transposase
VFLDGLWLKRSRGGEVRNVSLLVAIGVNDEGFRKVLAVAEGLKEDKASWTTFLRHLKERGLKGIRSFVSDKCLGLVESLGESYPEAMWQRCTVHFYRNVRTAVPPSKVKEVAAMLKAIHAQEDRVAARQKAEQVTAKLKEMKLADAVELVRRGIERHCSTTRFRGSTGGVCGRTTRWSASCVRYDEERGRWGRFRTGSRRSCWRRPGCVT